MADYATLLGQAQLLSPEEQRRLRDELTAMIDAQPAGREPLENVEATLERIDSNPEIEGT